MTTFVLNPSMIKWLDEQVMTYKKENNIPDGSLQGSGLQVALDTAKEMAIPALLGKYHAVAYMFYAGEIAEHNDLDNAKNKVAQWCLVRYRSEFLQPPTVNEWIQKIDTVVNWLSLKSFSSIK